MTSESNEVIEALYVSVRNTMWQWNEIDLINILKKE